MTQQTEILYTRRYNIGGGLTSIQMWAPRAEQHKMFNLQHLRYDLIKGTPREEGDGPSPYRTFHYCRGQLYFDAVPKYFLDPADLDEDYEIHLFAVNEYGHRQRMEIHHARLTYMATERIPLMRLVCRRFHYGVTFDHADLVPWRVMLPEEDGRDLRGTPGTRLEHT